MNLGWKLAAAIRWTAPDDLLESYERERRPEGVRILDWSRAQVALMRPSPSSRALEAIIRDLLQTSDGATYFAGRVWGVESRYGLGDAHPLVGRSAPNFELADGTSSNQHLQNGRGLLLDFDGHESLKTLAACWSNRIRYVVSETKDRMGLRALLIRPDGIVAWVNDLACSEVEVASSASQWFGKPRPTTA